MLRGNHYKNICFLSIVFGIMFFVLSTYEAIFLLFSCLCALVACTCVALIYGNYYKIFKKIIAMQKRKLLEELATEFGESYLSLKTPFTAKEEKQIQNAIRNKKFSLILLWVLVAIIAISILMIFI